MPWLATIAPLIKKNSAPNGSVLRLSRIIWLHRKQYGQKDGEIIEGQRSMPVSIFRESRAAFRSDCRPRAKDRFFLDQREKPAAHFGIGPRPDCLNAFSFTALFPLCRARGAKSVTDLDISGTLSNLRKENFALNHDTVAHCEYRQRRATLSNGLSKAVNASAW